MKPNVKEVLKNKTDKMVDLIVDDIGIDGEKTLNASYFDNHHTDTKYIIQVSIKSGKPDILTDFEDTDILDAKISSLETAFTETMTSMEERIAALEQKEEYDDTEIKTRISTLEQSAIQDDTQLSQLIARIEALENKSEESP